MPSRTALWTGRWPTSTGVKSNGNLNDAPRFTIGLDRVIKSNGYEMAGIGKMFHSYLRLHPGQIYENTLIVFTADHGDYAGEYGLMKKGAGVPECLTRIPMIWHGPGIIRQPAPHPAHLSNTDVFPTLCEMLGVPLPEGVQGRSLWPLLSGRSYPEEEFASMLVMQGMGGRDYASVGDLDPYKEGALRRKNARFFDELNSWTQSGILRMLRKGDWKLVYDMQGRGELYHLSRDPAELKNLFGSPEYRDKQMELLQDMLAWELRTQDPLPLPKRYVLKRDPRNYWAPYRR